LYIKIDVDVIVVVLGSIVKGPFLLAPMAVLSWALTSFGESASADRRGLLELSLHVLINKLA
jgi:hypothetical protein